jgi:hypothetical protein
MVVFWPSISGAGTAPRWALLSVFVPMLIFFVTIEGKNRFLPFILPAAFLAYATVSLAWTPSIYEGLDALWKLYLLAGLFLIGASLDDLRPVWIGAALGIAVNSVFVVAQLFEFADTNGFLVPRIYGPAGVGAGLFLNKNLMAEVAVLVLIGLAFCKIDRKYSIPMLLAVLPAALLPHARGPLVALAVAAAAWLWPRYRATAVLALLAGALVVAVTFGSTPITSTSERFNIWRDTFSGLTWFGHGIGSFYQAFPAFAVHNDILAIRTDHAHSDLLEMVFELGAGAVLLAGVLVYALFGRSETERLVLIAFMVEGAFGFPIYCPATAALAALVVGHLCAHRHPVRVHVAARRMVPRGGLARPGDVRQPAPV